MRSMNGVRWFRAALALCALLAATAPTAATQERYHPAIDPELFPLPESLEPALEFWKDVFATWSSDQVVLHDERHLDVVYSVIDMGDLRSIGSSELEIDRTRIRRVRAEMNRTAKALRDLAAGRPVSALPADLRSIPEKMSRIEGGRSKYRRAAGMIRSQRGLRNRFEEAIEISGMFMPGIERILASYGVPKEVRCLPFVESMFNYRARSKVGASGAWQFTASTGRAFLQMDEAVDARSDVLLAAEGAARKLRQDHESLEAWPVALTAYNHGAGGMARAVRRLGTRDMGVIAEKYRSRTFGFASRNFYPEFLAAVIVYADREQHFPGVEPLPEIRFDVVDRERYVALVDLANGTGVSIDDLAELNPALDRSVLAGSLLVPPRYPLRVPPGTGEKFRLAPSTCRRSRGQRGRADATTGTCRLDGRHRRCGPCGERDLARHGHRLVAAVRPGAVATRPGGGGPGVRAVGDGLAGADPSARRRGAQRPVDARAPGRGRLRAVDRHGRSGGRDAPSRAGSPPRLKCYSGAGAPRASPVRR